ncbi:MAG: hypothetical protein IJB65_04005 [Clostridia bacterium]|nr:hypothetical protein [Clostridia bacterium]
MENDYLTYEDCKELLQKTIDDHKKYSKIEINGRFLLNNYLYDFDYHALNECERFNAILPLMVWQCKNNQVTEEIKGEIGWYYEEHIAGRLEPLLQMHEKEQIMHDFLECCRQALS